MAALTTYTGRTSSDGWQIVDVGCFNCYAYLGTMTTQTVSRALLRHRHVLCPDCRKRSCDVCNTFDVRLADDGGSFEFCDLKVCWLCYVELSEVSDGMVRGGQEFNVVVLGDRAAGRSGDFVNISYIDD